MAASPAFEMFVKADPTDAQKLGDCPFCHRVLLTLEEKQVPYKRTLINLQEKPQWLTEVNPPNGSVPVVKDLQQDKWVTDSDRIVDYIEEKFAEPHLGTSKDVPSEIANIFPNFIAFLKSKRGTDDTFKKRGAFVGELEALGRLLRARGPFLAGQQPGAADLALAPKLHAAQVALRAFQDFEFTECGEEAAQYLDRMRARDSWKKTQYSDQAVLAGWKKHVEG